MNVTVTVECDIRLGLRLAHLACRLWPVLGRDRAGRLAVWITYRLARWRIGNGRWRRGITAEFAP